MQGPGSGLCFCLAEAGCPSEPLPSPGCGGRKSPPARGGTRGRGRQFPLEANTWALTWGMASRNGDLLFGAVVSLHSGHNIY